MLYRCNAVLSIVIIAIFLPSASSQFGFDDLTVGGNFSVDYVSFPGLCINITGDLVATDKRMYEGRWFYVYAAFERTQVDRLSCATWDSFFDQNGNLHDFLYMYENNEYRSVHTQLAPISAEDGVYSIAGNTAENLFTPATLFYIDRDMFVFWEVVCRTGGKSHFRNCAVGYRSLDLVEKKRNKLQRVLNSMKRLGADIVLYKIRHDKQCTYPPPRQNPYSNSIPRRY